MTTALLKRAAATAALATLALSGAAQANPVVIDFESALPLTVVGPGQPGASSYTESGVTFTPTGSDAIVDSSYCAVGAESCIRDNSSVYLTALNGAEVTITAPRAFSINSIDAAFLPLPTPVELFRGSLMGLHLLGTLWDGGLVESWLTLPEDPANPGDFLFGTTGFISPLFRSLTLGACVYFGSDCVRSGADFDNAGYLFNDLQFAIDNLSLSIPEPSALWLVALSLSGLALPRRRSAQ